ncbi:hypothetical protein BH23CHL8_BH23CHL8_01650 [soil metagenome]
MGLVSIDEDGQATGYGVIRRCREGWKVGPLLAPDEGAAERLLHGLAAIADPDDPIFLDVPEPNGAAVRLAERNAMTPTFETARMVSGSVPDEPVGRIFGVTTFELG